MAEGLKGLLMIAALVVALAFLPEDADSERCPDRIPDWMIEEAQKHGILN